MKICWENYIFLWKYDCEHKIDLFIWIYKTGVYWKARWNFDICLIDMCLQPGASAVIYYQLFSQSSFTAIVLQVFILYFMVCQLARSSLSTLQYHAVDRDLFFKFIKTLCIIIIPPSNRTNHSRLVLRFKIHINPFLSVSYL